MLLKRKKRKLIHLKENSANTVILTLKEKATLSSPTYLFHFRNDITGADYYVISADVSTATGRYNKFTITEGVDDQLNGSVLLGEGGYYSYTIYEQSSPSNLDPTLATGVVERGKMLLLNEFNNNFVEHTIATNDIIEFVVHEIERATVIAAPTVNTLTIFTNSITPTTFDPSISKTGAATDWDYGDTTTESANNSPSKVYTLAGTKKVLATFDDITTVTSIDFSNDDVIDSFNCSGCVNFSVLDLRNNNNLTSVTFPTSSTVISSIHLFSTGVSSLDFSPLSGLGGTIHVYNNSSLTSITNPSSSESFVNYFAYNCDLTGTLNMSGLTGLSGSINLRTNPNLTSVTLPTSSGAITSFAAEQCDLTGTFNASTLSNMSGVFWLHTNPNLTSVTFPSNSNTFTQIYFYSCDLGYIDFTTIPNATEVNSSNIQLQNNNMTAAEVNQILVDLDTNSTGGFTGRSITISGTNAAPDGSSGGYDGSTAKTNLIAKGFTVTTS